MATSTISVLMICVAPPAVGSTATFSASPLASTPVTLLCR